MRYVYQEMKPLTTATQLSVLRTAGFTALLDAPPESDAIAPKRHGCTGGAWGLQLTARSKQPRTGPCQLSYRVVRSCLSHLAPPSTARRHSCRFRHALAAQFAAKATDDTLLYPMAAFLEQHFPQWRKAAGVGAEDQKRLADKRTCGANAYKAGKLISSTSWATRQSHGKSSCDHLVCHYGPRLDAIQDGVNNAMRRCRETVEHVADVKKRANVFCLCKPRKVRSACNPTRPACNPAQPACNPRAHPATPRTQEASDAKAKECAAVKSGLMLSKANYQELRTNVDCVPYDVQREAGRKLLGGGPSGYASAAFETLGRRSERSGAAVLPSWVIAKALEERQLVEGVLIKGRAAPRPATSVGFVFANKPLAVFVTFSSSARHAGLFVLPHPAVRVAQYLAHGAGVQLDAFLPSMRAAPRLSTTRTAARHGTATEELPTAILSVASHAWRAPRPTLPSSCPTAGCSTFAARCSPWTPSGSSRVGPASRERRASELQASSTTRSWGSP